MELKVDGWSVGARFSVCHYIPLHHKCGRLHGHSYAVSVNFEGEMPEDGDMMVDFIAVKRVLRELCEELDHRVIVLTENPDSIVAEEGDNVTVDVHGKHYSFPKEDVIMLPIMSSTAERLAEWFLGRLVERMEIPDSVEEIELGIEEGQGQGAWAEWERD